MLKDNKIGFIFTGGCLICLLTLAGCRAKQPEQTNQPPADNAGQPVAAEPILSPAEQEAAYETGVKAGLRPFWQQQDISGIKDSILDLRAPNKYLNLHLNLVIALENLEQGKASGDQAKIELAIDKLNELKNQYPWIAQ